MAWPDVVQLVTGYLRPLVDPIHVGTRVPDPRPDRFVTVRRIGGNPSTVRDTARLDVQCWAIDEPDATALALQIREHMWALSGTILLGPPCYRVDEFMGLRQVDDRQTGTPIAWVTYELDVRADDAIHIAP